MSSHPSAFDLRALGRLLDEEDYDFVSNSPASSLSTGRHSTLARSTSARRGATLTMNAPSRPSGITAPSTGVSSGGEFSSDVKLPRSVGGGGVYLESALETPRGLESPMPVIFLSKDDMAMMCHGLYAATSRFCIKTVIPGLHHCGIASHKKKYRDVVPNAFWAPGGFIKGHLVAMCGECVVKDKTCRHAKQVRHRRDAHNCGVAGYHHRRGNANAHLPIGRLNDERS